MKKTDVFETIDNYFANKKQSETYLIIIILMAIIGFVIWFSLFPVAQDYFDYKISENETITTKLNQELDYLASKNVNGDQNYYVKQRNSQIKSQKYRLKSIDTTNAYIDKKLRELSYLLFNNKNWAKFLDSVSEVAKKHSVKIVKISNEINEPNFQKFEPILKIHVELNGDYHPVMNFINTLEESQLIVDIHNLDLNSSKKIDGIVDIAVWGLKY